MDIFTNILRDIYDSHNILGIRCFAAIRTTLGGD